MIPVTPQPEPQGFNTSVRQRGNEFLARSSDTQKLPKYWQKAAKDLYAAYKGICAYTCMYFMPPGTVDHFLPKSHYRQLAYEWSNYRLATPQANTYKGDSIDIIDPFIVKEGWFIIDFPSCLVRAASNLSLILTEQIENTIKALKLNEADPFVQDRCDLVLYFLNGHISFDFLSRRYPFLAAEILRQGGKDTIRGYFKHRSN